jgi:L-fuculose-phosphate aldolase
MEHRELRGEIARAARQMSASGLVPTTSGNVSARTPEGNVLITPSGLAYDVLEPEDIVLVSLDGEALEGTLEPSSEVPMHTGLYRSKPHVGGVVHTHAPYATALSCLALEIPPVHYLLAALSVCLLQNHGTIAVGETVGQAYAMTEILEEMAEIYYRTKLAGEPVLLSPEQVADTRAKIVSYGQTKPVAGETE